MKTALRRFNELAIAMMRQAKVRKGMLAILAVVVILQIYFVRELLAAELLFGLAFAVALLFGAIFYIIGTLGERGWVWTESGAKVIAKSARRGYNTLEEISKKSLRDPNSESAQ